LLHSLHGVKGYYTILKQGNQSFEILHFYCAVLLSVMFLKFHLDLPDHITLLFSAYLSRFKQKLYRLRSKSFYLIEFLYTALLYYNLKVV